jgi:hypothetical protein
MPPPYELAVDLAFCLGVTQIGKFPLLQQTVVEHVVSNHNRSVVTERPKTIEDGPPQRSRRYSVNVDDFMRFQMPDMRMHLMPDESAVRLLPRQMHRFDEAVDQRQAIQDGGRRMTHDRVRRQSGRSRRKEEKVLTLVIQSLPLRQGNVGAWPNPEPLRLPMSRADSAVVAAGFENLLTREEPLSFRHIQMMMASSIKWRQTRSHCG